MNDLVAAIEILESAKDMSNSDIVSERIDEGIERIERVLHGKCGVARKGAEAQRDKGAGETPATRDTRYVSRDTSNNVPEDRILRNRAGR